MAKSGKKNKKDAKSLQIKNKKAYWNYELIEKIEAGICLSGTEVKSLRAGCCDLSGSYARFIDGELFLVGANIAVYENAGYCSHQPDRNRKLLLHKRQLLKLRQKLEQKGFTIVPLRVYFTSRGHAKVEIATAKGRKKYDDRDKLRDKQFRKELRY